MPTTKSVPVKGLSLDLKNFRTVPQKSEAAALRAMVSISPDWFWALMESLLDDGYHPTENIIVQRSGGKLVVREGNRRVAAMKLAHGLLKRTELAIPSNIEERLKKLDAAWKKQNLEVPCAVFDAKEQAQVDRIVTLTHGKGDRAGRDKWNPVAKARHNRDVSGASEPALDILEAYVGHGKNLTPTQAERWTGDYHLTVLEEALKRLASRLGFASSRALADSYPKSTKHKAVLESVMHDIGVGSLDFNAIRDSSTDFAARYGVAPAPTPAPTPAPGGKAGGAGAGSPAPTPTPAPGGASAAAKKKTAAVAVTDPRSVARQLKPFAPQGKNREKLVTLLQELRKLKLKVHPHAFCFLLRSMFEISAKAYCDDHKATGGPKMTGKDGKDRPLVDVLRDIANHLTKNKTDKQMEKALHGAMVSLGTASSILSVTSMNQLIHNPKFSINEGQIAQMFNNIFPLLEEMNR